MEQSNALLQVSEIQLVYKPVIRPSQRLKVGQASDVYKMLLDSWDMDSIDIVEQFKIMLLNRANKVLGVSLISTWIIGYSYGFESCVCYNIKRRYNEFSSFS